MKRNMVHACWLCALLFPLNALGKDPITPQEPIVLFNGKDLDGFYTFIESHGIDNDPQGVFKVEDGAIHISGAEYGYVITKEAYANYRLLVEFKWGEKTHAPRVENARDSGILYHVPMDAKDLIWPHSIECQFIEGGTGDLLVVNGGSIAYEDRLKPHIADGAGFSGDKLRITSGRVNWYHRSPEWKDVVGFRGEHDLEKPLGEWNTVEVIANDDRVTHLINGEEAIRATGCLPKAGKILIQSEGAELFIRRMELLPIE